MNKKILSIVSITVLPISVAFAQSNSTTQLVDQPSSIQQNDSSSSPNAKNQTDGMPPSEMQVPDSGAKNAQEEQDLQPSSSTNSNIPTSGKDVNTEQFNKTNHDDQPNNH